MKQGADQMTPTKKRKPRLTATPHLRPGTYTIKQVLLWVHDRIKEEPKRLNMAHWCSMFKGMERKAAISTKHQPKCGTVACLAGWINIAVGNDRRDRFAGVYARKALGLPTSMWANDSIDILSADLDRLFMSVDLRKPQVLARLRALIAAHPAVNTMTITVPPKDQAA